MKKLLVLGMLFFCGSQEVLGSAEQVQNDVFARCAQRAFASALERMDTYREMAVRVVRAREQEIVHGLQALPIRPRQVIADLLHVQLQDDETAQLVGRTLKELERADELIESANRVEDLWGKPELGQFLRRVAVVMRGQAHYALDAVDVDGFYMASESPEALSDKDRILVELYELFRDFTRKNAGTLDKFGRNLSFLKRRADKTAVSIVELRQQLQEARDALSQLQESAQERENRLVRLEGVQQRERYVFSVALIGVFAVLIWHVLTESVV